MAIRVLRFLRVIKSVVFEDCGILSMNTSIYRGVRDSGRSPEPFQRFGSWNPETLKVKDTPKQKETVETVGESARSRAPRFIEVLMRYLRDRASCDAQGRGFTRAKIVTRTQPLPWADPKRVANLEG